MKRYWLDANTFITAKDGLYAFDINKSFWNWLDGRLKAGVIVAPSKVFSEVVNDLKKDELARWMKSRKGLGLCQEPSKDVCIAVREIADYVFASSRYKQAQAMAFGKGADAWLIAHAKVDRGVVVTFETDKKPLSQKIRIPDVCEHFGVECVSMPTMLRTLNAKL